MSFGFVSVVSETPTWALLKAVSKGRRDTKARLQLIFYKNGLCAEDVVGMYSSPTPLARHLQLPVLLSNKIIAVSRKLFHETTKNNATHNATNATNVQANYARNVQASDATTNNATNNTNNATNVQANDATNVAPKTNTLVTNNDLLPVPKPYALHTPNATNVQAKSSALHTPNRATTADSATADRATTAASTARFVAQINTALAQLRVERTLSGRANGRGVLAQCSQQLDGTAEEEAASDTHAPTFARVSKTLMKVSMRQGSGAGASLTLAYQHMRWLERKVGINIKEADSETLSARLIEACTIDRDNGIGSGKTWVKAMDAL